LSDLGQAFREAIRLILSADADVTTIVAVSHDLSFVSSLASRIVSLNRGKISDSA
jgi:ABC-type sulfate/molybdate transport systems ATPase subunit